MFCLVIFQRAVLRTGQGSGDLGRYRHALLQTHTILKMAHAQQGHEGDGHVRTNASWGSVKHGVDAQVVLGDPRDIFNLQQFPVLIWDGGSPGRIWKIDYDPVPTILARIGDDGLGTDPHLGGASLAVM